MKLHPPLRMAFAVLVLYAFLTVFFLDGDRRESRQEPYVAAEVPRIVADPEPGYRIIPAGVTPLAPTSGSLVPGQATPAGGRDRADFSPTPSPAAQR